MISSIFKPSHRRRDWDFGSLSFANSKDLTGEVDPTGFTFSHDGTKVYFVVDTEVSRYTLGIAWDVTTISFSTKQSFITTQSEGDLRGISFSRDGTKMYLGDGAAIAGGTGVIYQYLLPTPWSLTGAGYDNISYNYRLNSSGDGIREMHFDATGTKLYIIDHSIDYLAQHSLSVPWDIGSVSFIRSFNTLGVNITVDGVTISPNGRMLIMTGNSPAEFYHYLLDPPWNISSPTSQDVLDITAQNASPLGNFVSPNGTKMYTIQAQGPRLIMQYNMDPV